MSYNKRIVTYTHATDKVGYKPDYSTEIEAIEDDDFKEVVEYIVVSNVNPDIASIQHFKVTQDPPNKVDKRIDLYRENGLEQIDNMIAELLRIKERWFLMNKKGGVNHNGWTKRNTMD